MSALLRAALVPIVAGDQLLPRELGLYLVKVLRLRAGDRFVLFDPLAALEADAELLSDIPARARVGTLRPAARGAVQPLVLIHGLSKGDKAEHVARAAVALGVTTLVFARTARSVVRSELRRERLQSVMLDVARQSGRGDLPVVLEVDSLAAALPRADGLELLLEPLATRALADVLGQRAPGPLTLAIGPEGGFASEELELLAASGFEGVRLGRFVLRTEMAVVAALGTVAAFER